MSHASLAPKALDLSREFPRSPNAMVGHYILLARIIDKCRAVLAGTQGEYNYNCPLDQRFFNRFEVDADGFKAQVAQGKTDEELLAWVDDHSKTVSDDDVRIWTYTTRWDRPTTPEKMAYFEALREEVAPENYQLETWFQLLDADEGRL